MDIYEYLQNDHRKVDKLFQQFIATHSAENQLDIASLIQKELIIHAEAEENTFYKELEKYREGKDEVKHGEKEHTQIKNKLKEISQLSPSNEKWKNKILELKALVEHHVHDEEGDMFAEAKKVLSPKEACVLKDQMHDYKNKLLSTYANNVPELLDS